MTRILARQQRVAYLEAGQVSGRLPVLVLANAGHPREPDGDAISRVDVGLGKLCPCDLPHL